VATTADLGTSQLGMDVVLGEVYYAHPSLNTYVVKITAGDKTEQVVLAVSSSVDSTRRSGVRGGTAYMPGTKVLIALTKYPLPGIGLQQYSRVSFGFIIGSAPLAAENAAQGFRPIALHGNQLTWFTETLTNAFIATQTKPVSVVDASAGVPTDVLAGDYTRAGTLQNFLSIGSIRSSIGGSPMARVDCFGLYDKVRITAAIMEQCSHTLEAGHYPDKDSVAFYDWRAMTESEGLGAVTGAPFQVVSETAGDVWEPLDPEQMGVFRHRKLEGKVADGEWEILADPEVDTGVSTKSTQSDVPQPGRLSIRKRYDGSFELRAANRIDLVRSLYIPVPSRLQPEDATSFAKADADSKSYRDNTGATLGSFYDAFSAAYGYDEFDYNALQYDNRRMRARTDTWKVYSRTELETKFGVSLADGASKLEALEPTEPLYPDPPYVELDAPVTEETQKLSAVESCIRQLPDGAVVISDGSGGEIRMHRGRITITCAGDIEIRPGRDLIEMTPRNRVLNVGQDLYIQSAKGSVNLKAETDLKMLAGNSGSGTLVLESRSDRQEPESGESIPHGIVIKSKTSLGILAANMYMGLRSAEAAPKGGLSRSGSGSITVDACSGTLALMGSDLYARIDDSMALAVGSALVGLAGGSLGMAVSSVGLTTGVITLSAPDTTAVDAAELGPDGMTSEQVNLASGTPTVLLRGNMMVDGQILAQGLIAQDITAGSGSFGNAAWDSGLSGGQGPGAMDIPDVSIGGYMGPSDSFAAAADPDDNDLYDEAMLWSSLVYPDAAGYKASNARILAARWQIMMKNANAGDVWAENPVERPDGSGDTWIWPGEAWAGESSPYMLGLHGLVTLTQYITNTP